MRFPLVFLLITLVLAASMLSCSDESASFSEPAMAPVAASAGNPGLPQSAAATDEVSAISALPAASAPAEPAQASSAPAVEPLEFSRVQQSTLAQNRIVVHTATMALVVVSVPQAMDGITGLAAELGGWVVNADRGSASKGSIAVRVPAESLHNAMARISRLGVREESRAISSQDVTEEFVDSQSRLESMRATERRLLSFLEQAVTVEDALLVQEQLNLLQQDIEQTQGRINALSQTAAFSLIEVSLRVAPIAIGVDVGPDVSGRAGEPLRFKAVFQSTPGIEDFSFTWKFGDASQASGSGTALTPEGSRVTATVSHTYTDDSGSPYIVTFKISGSGEGGIVEGSDTLLVTVKSVPPISLFAGQDRTVEEGEETDYSASFTRPDGLWDFKYRWDFGDGSATVQGAPEEGATRVTVPHTYRVYHPNPYTATVTVTAMSDAGPVTATQSFRVYTSEVESFVISGWDVTDTTKSAVRALSVSVYVLSVLAIWALVFSPVIAIILGACYLILRHRPEWFLSPSRRPSTRSAPPASQRSDEPPQGDGPST